MLQQPALEAWTHETADLYRNAIDFTGVFIATDLAWGAQVAALGGGRLDSETHRLLAEAAFTTHVLRSLVISILYRIKREVEPGTIPFKRIEMSDHLEATLAREIAESWYLQPTIPSLLSVKQALSLRLAKIKEIASREVVSGEGGRQDRLAAIDFLHLDFLHASSVATEKFDDMIGEPDSRWSLMFDELEIAPAWIRDDLIRMLRSTEPRFLFKLALNPFSQGVLPLEDALGPAPDHDYEQIPLWYAERHEGYEFCDRLWYSMLEEKGIPRQTPSTALGESAFETPSSEWKASGTAYGAASRLSKMFIRLAQNDKSFGDYLRRKNIDPKALHLVQADQRAADVRKVAPLLPIREFYRTPDRQGGDGRQFLRSRKSAKLYVGAEAVFAISEGNPRWFIAIVGRMLDGWGKYSKKLPPRLQADEIAKGAERFSAMLRTIPVKLENGKPSVGGLLSVLDEVGRYFHGQIVRREFTAEPAGTFTIDNGLPDSLVEALGLALNAGAIVYCPEDRSQMLLKTLRGHRFRMSYLLAPNYGLALRLGRQVNLSLILREESRKKADQGQLRLAGGENRDI
jgi:hypothetical protein